MSLSVPLLPLLPSLPPFSPPSFSPPSFHSFLPPCLLPSSLHAATVNLDVRPATVPMSLVTLTTQEDSPSAKEREVGTHTVQTALPGALLRPAPGSYGQRGAGHRAAAGTRPVLGFEESGGRRWPAEIPVWSPCACRAAATHLLPGPWNMHSASAGTLGSKRSMRLHSVKASTGRLCTTHRGHEHRGRWRQLGPSRRGQEPWLAGPGSGCAREGPQGTQAPLWEAWAGPQEADAGVWNTFTVFL